jgi:hypothetical protein
MKLAISNKLQFRSDNKKTFYTFIIVNSIKEIDNFKSCNN